MRESRGAFERARIRIGKRVRALRQERQWTQAELADRLNLSQSRFSEIERGHGSFTAEQFLVILRLFNAPLSDFSDAPSDPHAEIQNTLARLGAAHLRESTDVLPSEQLADVGDAVREALLAGTPRLITGLAPVLVRHADNVNLGDLSARLTQIGLQRRLGWLVENTLEATEREWWSPRPVFGHDSIEERKSFLDRFSISSSQRVASTTSQIRVPISSIEAFEQKQCWKRLQRPPLNRPKRWKVVTSLQPRDFEEALRLAEAQ